jgi:hypothetical protein
MDLQPQTLTLQFKDVAPAFPTSLKRLERWIVRSDDKRPFSAYEEDDNRGPIDPHDEQFQAEYDTALGALEQTTRYSGLGFVFNYTDGLTGVDFDDCVNAETREIRPDIQAILAKIDSYAEFSPSGTGIHIFVSGWQFPLGPEGQQGAKIGKAEIYSGKRYFTVTGDHVPGTPTTVNSRDLDWLYERIVQYREFAMSSLALQASPVPAAPATNAAPIVSTSLVATDKLTLLMTGTVKSDSPFVVEDGFGNSVTYPSHSEADMALCTVLALKHGDKPDVIDSKFRKSPLYRPKWERDDYRDATISKAVNAAKSGEVVTLELTDAAKAQADPVPDIDENSEAAIPPFDPSVVKGIYAKFVELATRGTTMSPQFSFAVAKTIIGARMAGNVKFENLDVEPRFYTTLVGETGSGKGEAYRRVLQIVKPQGSTENIAKIKFIDSADSGAGLRDLFFASPTELPVLCYIDEAASLGNKAADTRNPAIIDQFIELADKTTISRVLAKRGRQGGTKSKDDARLSIVMCGQSGEVFMKAFAGRTKLGWYDRLYPEYGTAVETGDMPPVNVEDAYNLLAELEALDYSGTMTMSDDCKSFLDGFWNRQPNEVRKKARWKKNLYLDTYMSAFGRSVKTADVEDAVDAVKIFTRQLVIRSACFTSEAPDRVGYYIGLMKRITEHMITRLAASVPEAAVAKSKRDFETETHAYRDNELHIFNRAWIVFQPSRLRHVSVKKANGQEYVKFVPAEE